MTIKAFINAVKGEKWCQWLTVLMRLTVGGVFIFSGFTKGVDPWPFQFPVIFVNNRVFMSIKLF